jgi:membrane-associated phospholipid phosphatase
MAWIRAVIAIILWAQLSAPARADGGALAIDHHLPLDDTGIWKQTNERLLRYLLVGGTLGIAVWEGGETRLGQTAWKALDATLAGVIVVNVAKPIFSRTRPRDRDDPDLWFQGRGNDSFPSGAVTTVTAVITPYIAEYHRDTAVVWTLALLPVYTGIARMKAQAHWQTDVLAGMALGGALGYYAHSRDSSFLLEVLPDGVMVGLRKRF